VYIHHGLAWSCNMYVWRMYVWERRPTYSDSQIYLLWLYKCIF
jgi:hypothetical protein